MSKTLLTAFTTQLTNFLDELVELCPEEKDFQVFRNAILLLKKTNPRKIIELFDKYTSTYRKAILEKDEKFILNDNYDTIIGDIDSSSENIWSTIAKLRKYWGDLSSTNKETIWKYFHVLINLSDMIKKA